METCLELRERELESEAVSVLMGKLTFRKADGEIMDLGLQF